MCTLCLREKKQEMRLSVSMMQAFPCSYFSEKIMNSSRHDSMSSKKDWKQQHKQQLGKDRLRRPPTLARLWEERKQEVMWQRWRCSASPKEMRWKAKDGEVRVKGIVWKWCDCCRWTTACARCHGKTPVTFYSAFRIPNNVETVTKITLFLKVSYCLLVCVCVCVCVYVWDLLGRNQIIFLL